MTGARMTTTWKFIVGGLLGAHILLYALLSIFKLFQPFELFNLLLLIGVIVIAIFMFRGGYDPLIGAGMMVLISLHAFIGQRMAPDHLTSGALLLVNLLVLYSGYKINTNLLPRYWIIFIASFVALYSIFIIMLKNSEPLFILFLLAMTACARSFRLMTYFWAVTISFTFLQPYAWEATIISCFIITAFYRSKGAIPVTTARFFLLIGLALVFLVLLPVIIAMGGQDIHNMQMILRDARIVTAMKMTAITATISTLILIIFIVPLAYGIARLKFPGKNFMLSLIDLPIVIPQSAAGIALLNVFGRKQIIGGALFELFGVPIDGTVLGICVAQIFVAMPFLAKSAIASFEAVNEQLEVTAMTLGASSWGAFKRIALPLASRGIFMGAVLAWARAAGEFGAVIFIAPVPETAPVSAFNRFNSVGMVETAPLIAVLLIFSLAMFFLLQVTTKILPGMRK